MVSWEISKKVTNTQEKVVGPGTLVVRASFSLVPFGGLGELNSAYVCHCCQAQKNAHFLTNHFNSETMNTNRTKVEIAANCIVQWAGDADGRNVRAGPGAIHAKIIVTVVIVVIILIFNLFEQLLNSMKLKEKKQKVISSLMLFGWFLISVLI